MYDVTYKTPDITPIVSSVKFLDCISNELRQIQFRFAEIPATRKRAMEGHESRLAINVPLLERALELRRRIASLLGYKTWCGIFSFSKLGTNETSRADYITEVKMIKTGKGAVEASFQMIHT